MAIAIKEGVPGGTSPSPDRTGTTPELPLAIISVPPNSAAVPTDQISDLREFTSRRIRMSAKGSEDFPLGSIYYNVEAGRFYARVWPKGAPWAESAPVPRYKETIVPRAANSSEYPPQNNGALVWDEALSSLLIQSSTDWNA